MSVTATHVGDIERLSGARSMEIADAQARALLDLLGSLQPEEWERVTVCDPWTVKDIAAHVLAWAEAVVSPKELTHQFVRSLSERKRFDGVLLHAQNDVQVRERAALTPTELLERLEAIVPRFNRARRVLRTPMKLVPYRDRFSGDWVSLGASIATTFTRDHFMHRLDISAAVEREPVVVPSDATIVADVVREWSGRTDADVRLELAGPAGGTYVSGAGAAGTIRADAFDLMRRLAGRPAETLEVEGDVQRIEGWLAKLATF